MSNNVVSFLRTNNIFFRSSGKNISKNCVGIKCPLCEESDTSEHCNINLKTGRFFCWRDKTHKGTFKQLVKLITGVWGVGSYVIEDSRLASLLKKKIKEKKNKESITLDFIRSINDISRNSVFVNYLITDRGFSKNEIRDLVNKYDLRGTNVGDWAWRIIFPLTLNGTLVSWLGRAVGESTLPYMELGIEDSVIPPKELLFNYDEANTGGKVLFITEGVFDAIKIDFYSPDYIKAVCLFTKYIKSKSQFVLLANLVDKFDMFCILLDTDAQSKALTLYQELSVLGIPIVIGKLPSTVKDPGELTSKGVDTLLIEGGFYG